MSEKTFLEKLERQLRELDGQIRELSAKRDVLAGVVADYRAETGVSPAPAPRAGSPAPFGKQARRGRKPRSSGGMTVKDAILKVVGEAKEPLTPAEIIPAVVTLSKGAEGSIRSQLSPMAKQGLLKQIEHEGRGYKYSIGSASASPQAPAQAAPPRAGKARKRGSGRKKATSSGTPASPLEADPQIDPVPPM